MVNLNIQTQNLDEQTNLQEIAHLTCNLWKITRPEITPTVERISNWIKNLKYEIAPVIIQGYQEETLVAWLLLFVHDSKRLNINPWALDGHPHISPVISNADDRNEIAELMLQNCIDYAMNHSHTRIDFSYQKKDFVNDLIIKPSDYAGKSFSKNDEIVFLTRNLSNKQTIPKSEFPKELKLVLLKDAPEEELYSCFIKAFHNSGDRNMLSHTEEEMKSFFKESFSEDEERIEQASVILYDGKTPIGFTQLRPTHGEGNGHLWEIGVIPDYRGQKIGSKLLNHAITTLKKLNFTRMSLTVDCENVIALNLYKKALFIPDWRKISYVWKKEN